MHLGGLLIKDKHGHFKKENSYISLKVSEYLETSTYISTQSVLYMPN